MQGLSRSGKSKAKGICGTGIIEAVAEMVTAGVILKSRRLNLRREHPRLRNENGPEFILARAEQTSLGKDITLSQHDAQALALAKAAMYGACKVLLNKLGIARPDKVILAGAFGSLVDSERAMAIGLFPDMDPKDVRAVGNAAGDGARNALLNAGKRAEADRIALKVEHVDFALEKRFPDEFAYALQFPHMRDELSHLRRRLAENLNR